MIWVPTAKKVRRHGEPMATAIQPGYLPIDIFYMILLSLPVKTLSRFRCVCKTWSSLISSPLFQHDHYGRSQETLYLLLAQNPTNTPLHLSTYEKETTPVNKFSTPIPPNTYLSHIQSCRGLLCVASPDRILLCNPSTQELLSLPPFPPPPVPGRTYCHCFGFGYAASSHQFKVVRFFRDYNPYDPSVFGVTHCQVFTLGTARWRKAMRPPLYHPIWRGVPFLHGALHILPMPHQHDAAAVSIVAFDIHLEKYKQIPLPAAYHHSAMGGTNGFHSARLTELRASVCLTLQFFRRLDLWLLEDYNNGDWTKRYTVDINCLLDSSTLIFLNSILPLLFVINGNLFFSITGLRGSWLVCYDPHKKAVTHKIDQRSFLTHYVDSFLSLGTR